MRESNDPRRIEYVDGPSGLGVVRQGPPAGARSFAATYIGPAGWAYDPKGGEGTARLAAQLVTSGAGRRGHAELARFLDRCGARLITQVDPETIGVTVWGPADAWEELLGVLADAILRPRYEDSDLTRVRRRLLEAQLQELAQPASRADRELLRAVFPANHPYRGTGMGDQRSVSRISRDGIDRFRRGHLVGKGGILVATGAPPVMAVARVARQFFSGLPSVGPPELPSPTSRASRQREVRVALPGLSQVEIRLGGTSVSRSNPRFPEAYLANEVLGGAILLSRLFRRVRARAGLAYYASSRLEAMRLGGYWVAQAGAGIDRWSRAVPMLKQEVARLSTKSPSRDELRTVCESRIGEIGISLETTAEAHELAVDAAYYGLPPDHWVQWPSTLRALTPKEVRDTAEIAFDPASAVTILAGPIRRPT